MSEPRFTTPVQSRKERLQAESTVHSREDDVNRLRGIVVSNRIAAVTTPWEFSRRCWSYMAGAAAVTAVLFPLGIWLMPRTEYWSGTVFFVAVAAAVATLVFLANALDRLGDHKSAAEDLPRSQADYAQAKAALIDDQKTLDWMIRWDRLVRSTTPEDMARAGVRFDDVMAQESAR